MSNILRPISSEEQELIEKGTQVVFDHAMQEYQDYLRGDAGFFLFYFALSNVANELAHRKFLDELMLTEREHDEHDNPLFWTPDGVLLGEHILATDEFGNPDVIGYYAGEVPASAQVSLGLAQPDLEC